jgi:uncharacterized protein YjbJ (UPF0337 family)
MVEKPEFGWLAGTCRLLPEHGMVLEADCAAKIAGKAQKSRPANCLGARWFQLCVLPDRRQNAFNVIFSNPSRKETEMEWDRIEGNWQQHKCSFKREWSELTNMNVITGERKVLALHIQERYGISGDEAEQQLADWQGRQREIECSA